MSPIFVRPVREQLEHDRLIRFLQTKYKKKFDVGINLGDEQAAPVKIGAQTFYPDLVLNDGKRLAGLVEVETGESVNNLEAMAQWVPFARSRVPFHLYVPVQGFDTARRLCQQNAVVVSELWTYRAAMDGFDLVRMFQDASAAASGAREARKSAAAAAAGKTAASRSPRPKSGKSSPKPSRQVRRPAKATRPGKPAGRAAARSARKPARSKKAAAGKR